MSSDSYPKPAQDPGNPALLQRLQQLEQRIAAACTRYARDPAQIQLLAVSKNHPAMAIKTLLAAGQNAFGESYAQEGIEKINNIGHQCQWHFIGPLQSNKTSQVAEHFDWVQSLERVKIAQRLSQQRPQDYPPLQICLQINISNEASKAGISPAEAPGLARLIDTLPGLQLRGIMAIPRKLKQLEDQRSAFRQLYHLFDDLRQRGHSLDTLSMGMSGDLEAAIAEGSTLLRIGSALFGPRQARN